MVTQAADVFEIENTEYGFAYEDAPPSNKFKMVVPKLFGHLSGTGPDIVDGSSILENDSACKPTYDKKVNRIDYITVRFSRVPCAFECLAPNTTCGCGHSHCDGLYLWKTRMDVHRGVILKDSRFTVNFVNGDLSDPYVTD